MSLYISGCHHTEPGIEIREVRVPVPQPCLPTDEIPAEPPHVADQLNGNAAHDLLVVTESALLLRAAVVEMRAALLACASPGAA